ncbi:hypothetical protein [Dietzia cinnamea]|uniref:hypothetical protein n=1 Tax=Dietzia cinnamea TaxID=321318 RepID=UPI0021A7CA73|nr:hypothetical protein [Dietzia cinnamea]MCT1639737.1 hypothetical protein [Dietzia cinnamea]
MSTTQQAGGGVHYPRPTTETYPPLAGLADALNKASRNLPEGTADHFVARRATWDAQNPVRVIPREGGGFDVVLVVAHGGFDLEEAQRHANLMRHYLRLAEIDVATRLDVKHPEKWAGLMEEESDHYNAWRTLPAYDDTQEMDR